MTVKLSTRKITKLIRLHFQGFTQTSTAGKLVIDQSTVSFYIAEFSAMAEFEGLDATAKEFGVMDIVQELHSLGAELKKSGRTVEEAMKGHKVAVVLEDCGVPENNYKDVIKTCVKMNDEDFLSAAVELHQIEENTGKVYEEIVNQAASLQTQNQQAEKKLVATQDMIESVKHKLAESQQQEKKAKNYFKQVLDKVGVDLERLKEVERLAKELKKAGVTDDELGSCIERQNLLNKSGVSIGIFTQIMNATKIPTTVDGGKNLLKKLIDFGSLDDAIVVLKQEKQSLIAQTKDLDEKAKLKGALQVALTHLQAEKKGLEGSVAQLHYQEETTSKSLDHLKSDHKALSEKVTTLTAAVSEKQSKDQELDTTIEQKQKNVADLEDLETKRDATATELADLSLRTKEKKTHLMILEAMEGLIESTSLEKLEKFIAYLPDVLEEVKKGKYTPHLLRAYIFGKLTGETMKVLKCGSCGNKFYSYKPADTMGYYCSACSTSIGITVDKDEIEILKATLAGTEPKTIISSVKIGKQQHLTTNDGSAT